MRIFTAAILLVSLMGCQIFNKTSKNEEASWSGQMQNMSEDIKHLVPYAYNRSAYAAPENKATIERALRDLTKQTHQVPEKMGKQFLGDDPIVEYSLNNLKSDLDRALYSFERGEKEYSRSVLKASVGHCFRCHSLTDVGAAAKWDLSGFSALELSAEEKLELLVAARKYEEAFQYAEKEITKPEILKNNPSVFESLLRKYLALSLRLNDKDTKKTAGDLTRVLENKEIPIYLQKQVKAWRDSLASWDKASSKGNYITLAERRIEKAKRLQEFAYDHAGDVEYIWATDVLHQGLRTAKKDHARAYYLLGVSYEVLGDLGAYGLHETYYEACVKKSPKTKLAKRCFDRLEASLIQGFSGTAGLSLPSEEVKRLEELKKLL